MLHSVYAVEMTCASNILYVCVCGGVQPEWRDVVAELSGAQQPGENDDNYIPLMPTQPAAANKKKK